MDAEKEAALQQLNSAIWLKIGLHFFSIPIGYAVSYYFQPELLRVKCPLGRYFACIKDVLTTRETAPTALIVTFIVAFAFEMLGLWVISHTRARVSTVLTKEEIAHCCGDQYRLVFGKIKEGEDNPHGSIKRIVKMVFIGLGIIFLFFIMLIVGCAAFS